MSSCEWHYTLSIILVSDLWLCWVFISAQISLELWAHGLLIAVASLVAERGLWAHGLQSSQHAGSRAQAQ